MKKATEENRYEQSAILESAESGNVEAQLCLGKMLCGLADRVDDGGLCPWEGYLVQYWDGTSCGMEWLKKASDSGNSEAGEILCGIKSGKIHLTTEAEYWHNMAMECIYGEGAAKNLEKGEELLVALADAEWAPAQRELAKLSLGLIDRTYECQHSHDPEELLEKASQKGDGEAQHRLAVLMCDGDWREYPVDSLEYKKGMEWLQSDAESGNPRSQFEYGEILLWLDGVDVKDKRATGLDYLKRSAENGYAQSALKLGMISADMGPDLEDLLQPNKFEAVAWFEKAIELGSSEAADRLGELLYHDAFDAFKRIALQQGSDEDEALIKKAYELTRTAAEAGLPCSQMRLAAMYSDGMGVEHNDAEARSWLLDAESSGSSLASECIDVILKQGMSTKDAIEACRGKIS